MALTTTLITAGHSEMKRCALGSKVFCRLLLNKRKLAYQTDSSFFLVYLFCAL